ncbi:MAG: hypothetical protein ACJ8R9_34100 [Steroidobacteraceae bacterium]
MPEHTSLKISGILAQCSENERKALFKALRASNQIHELEGIFGAPAEVILEAIHRAPELTRRMLRGVIADAAFAQHTIPMLAAQGWCNVTPEGNFSFDHLLQDDAGRISVQVKLQRSEKQVPVITTGTKFGLGAGMYMVEPQRTRGGKKRGVNGNDKDDSKTRPYRFGEFDVLAVSLQPSTKKWDSFRYTVGSWLIPGRGANEIATYQPVAMIPNDDWTDDFSTVARWFRAKMQKTIAVHSDERGHALW